MGARHSGPTRTVSIQNDLPVDLIDVSNDVVIRLKNALREKNDVTTPTAKGSDLSSGVIQKSENSSGVYESNSVSPSSKHKQNEHIVNVEPIISSYELSRQKEIELKKNDAYWRKRIDEMEQTINKTNAIIEKEYTDTFDTVQKRFKNVIGVKQSTPCKDLKILLIACYRANPNESLNCAHEVDAFINCVNKNRVQDLDNVSNTVKSDGKT